MICNGPGPASESTANEEATINDFLRRILLQLTAEDRVFCVLDNASKDQTRARVEAWAARDGRVVNVFALDIADGVVQAIRCVVNPDKLRHLGRVSQLAQEAPPAAAVEGGAVTVTTDRSVD